MARTVTMTNATQGAKHIVNELDYASYAANRDMFPQIKVERWAILFTNVPELEKRYQEEKCHNQKSIQ